MLPKELKDFQARSLANADEGKMKNVYQIESPSLSQKAIEGRTNNAGPCLAAGRRMGRLRKKEGKEKLKEAEINGGTLIES